MITDAQVHLWELDRPNRPWPKEARSQPHRPDGYSAVQMLAEMDAAGVDRAVIVPPTWAGDNNDTALEAVAAHPTRFAIMGRFDPFAPDAPHRIEGWRDQPGMLGIRLSRPQRWLDEDVDWFWTACERQRIPVMALVPGIAAKLRPTAAAHPALTLIVDHMAAVGGGQGPEAAFAGFEDLIALASFPQVRVKVSSAPCYSREPYPFPDLDPYIRRIYDAFGPRRMLWGADITRLTSTYAECLQHFQQALDFFSAEDRQWILGKSTAEALGWPEPSSK